MEKVKIKITMELLSDTILGSGYSIPGGHDISSNKDADGYPYVKSTVLKGLLRESTENFIVWTKDDYDKLVKLFGEGGWSETDEEGRLRVEPLFLVSPPNDSKQCFSERIFTSINECGVSKSASLRSAECIRSGLKFQGNILCPKNYSELIENSIKCIKWIGTHRSRGFGRVKFSVDTEPLINNKEIKKNDSNTDNTDNGNICIYYRLVNETQMIISDPASSGDNNYETKKYIPGSTIRGAVISGIVRNNKAYFDRNKDRILSGDTVRFLDAFPGPEFYDVNNNGKDIKPSPVLPALKGFYEDKRGEKFSSILLNNFDTGLKRAKMRDFCMIDQTKKIIRCWNTETESALRINRNSNEAPSVFNTQSISRGQCFEGYITVKDTIMASEIMNALNTESIWVGADRFEGFGKCSVKACEIIDKLPIEEAYGYSEKNIVNSDTICMLAVSPFTMLNEVGEPCGINEKKLAQKLGVEKVDVDICSTSVSEYGTFNRTWGCRSAVCRMYDRGSVFKLKLSGDLTGIVHRMQKLQNEGIGIRKNEGYGQILFFTPRLLENLEKEFIDKKSSSKKDAESIAELRRKKYQWVMDNCDNYKLSGVSKSQIGIIQSLCENARYTGNITKLEEFFNKNVNRRGADYSMKFLNVKNMIEEIIKEDLYKTLKVDSKRCGNSIAEKMELIILLFNYMRKKSENS